MAVEEVEKEYMQFIDFEINRLEIELAKLKKLKCSLVELHESPQTKSQKESRKRNKELKNWMEALFVNQEYISMTEILSNFPDLDLKRVHNTLDIIYKYEALKGSYRKAGLIPN